MPPETSPEPPQIAWPARLWAVIRPRMAAALVLATVLVGIAWLGPRMVFGPRVQTVAVVRRDFIESVVASGHVETPHRVNTGTQITGTVKRVPVAQGQSVRAGQVLIELESAEWSAALAGAARARSRLVYASIAALVDGTRIDRAVEPGDVVQPGKALMVLSPAGKTQLVLQIDEKNLQLLALGQKALASADAYPERRLVAELVYINPGVDVQRGSVEVKLNVPEPPPCLRQDMTVSVDIEVARRPQAVLVPTDALHDADRAQAWVLKVDAGRARRQPVRLGLRGGGFSEVLEGLRPGDLVVPAQTADIRDGSHLRAVVAAPVEARLPPPS